MSYPGLKKNNSNLPCRDSKCRWTLITNKKNSEKAEWMTIQLQLSGLRAVLGTCSLWITSCIWGWLWPRHVN